MFTEGHDNFDGPDFISHNGDSYHDDDETDGIKFMLFLLCIPVALFLLSL
jgi:hypothetical protein